MMTGWNRCPIGCCPLSSQHATFEATCFRVYAALFYIPQVVLQLYMFLQTAAENLKLYVSTVSDMNCLEDFVETLSGESQLPQLCHQAPPALGPGVFSFMRTYTQHCSSVYSLKDQLQTKNIPVKCILFVQKRNKSLEQRTYFTHINKLFWCMPQTKSLLTYYSVD